ncbi:MAG: lysoplasmalogenase family protein [Kiritimatiellae bacterium]|nr:lysoplasmalogenase family protein [Kiritimatiellia bacterium]
MPHHIVKLMLLLFTPTLLLVSAVFILRGGRACRSYWLAWTGLAATMIGDYFLAVKVSPLDSAGFLCGVAGFSLAHLCWIGFLCQHARWSPRIAFGLTLSLGVFFAARMLPAIEAPRLLTALSAYTLISIISVSFACGSHRLSSAWRYGLCLLLFSDAMIAFGHILRVPFLKNLIGLTYLASLLCIATAICRCSICPRPHARFRKLRQAPLFVLLGGPLAMALFLYAMRVCPISPYYNPFFKMLSYLGRTKINNIEYPLCHYLFSFALAASAYVSARFFPALSCFVRGARKKSLFLWGGALNAGGLLAIALVPENVHGVMHNVGCFAAVGGGAIMLLLMTPAGNNRRAPGSVRWGLLAWALILVALFQSALLAHRYKVMPFSPYVPTLQKMLILTFVGWITYYAVVLFSATRRNLAWQRYAKKLNPEP